MRVALLACILVLAACDQTTRAAKERVAAQLRDPASAQFRNVRTSGGVVCGEVNGKNAYGAYAGFSRFIVNPAVGDVLTDPGSGPTDDEAEMARLRCERATAEPLYSEAERELRVMACRQAADMYEKRAEAKMFEASYAASCPT